MSDEWRNAQGHFPDHRSHYINEIWQGFCNLFSFLFHSLSFSCPSPKLTYSHLIIFPLFQLHSKLVYLFFEFFFSLWDCYWILFAWKTWAWFRCLVINYISSKLRLYYLEILFQIWRFQRWYRQTEIGEKLFVNNFLTFLSLLSTQTVKEMSSWKYGK